uniref:Uncharacterized protein n=1 Tax=Romanomermis culicivorax TaxID=13658 RepID=A0A915HPU4_ROMCU
MYLCVKNVRISTDKLLLLPENKIGHKYYNCMKFKKWIYNWMVAVIHGNPLSFMKTTSANPECLVNKPLSFPKGGDVYLFLYSHKEGNGQFQIGLAKQI